jgi:hypothetical protein
MFLDGFELVARYYIGNWFNSGVQRAILGTFRSDNTKVARSARFQSILI